MFLRPSPLRAFTRRPNLSTPRSSSIIFLPSVAFSDDHHGRRGGEGSRHSHSHPPAWSQDYRRKVRVMVWWDFESCGIPDGVDAFEAVERIAAALRSCDIRGPISIKAFGDVSKLSGATQEALGNNNVILTHVPNCWGNSSDKFFVAGVVDWISRNPPPLHVLFISGDEGFANKLHWLRMSNYNVLVASTGQPSKALCRAATIMWPWNGLVLGKYASNKHLNPPPDGAYGSWYGHYEGARDNRQVVMEQALVSQPEESAQLVSVGKPDPIPEALANEIRQLVDMFPEGLSMSELRSKLQKKNVHINKDFFGHKKFSHLLAAMPDVLRFAPDPSGEGQPLVIATCKRTVGTMDNKSKSKTDKKAGDLERDHTSKASVAEGQVSIISADEKGPTLSQDDILIPSQSATTEATATAMDTSSMKRKQAEVVISDVPLSHGDGLNVVIPTGSDQDKTKLSLDPKEATESAVTSASLEDHAEAKSFFKNIRVILFGHGGGNSNKTNPDVVDSTGIDNLEKEAPKKAGSFNLGMLESEEKTAQMNRNPSSSIHFAASFSQENISQSGSNTTKQAEDNNAKETGVTESFFGHLWTRWKILMYGTTVQNQDSDAIGVSSSELSQNPKHNNMVLTPILWDSMESFLVSQSGAKLVLQARTRKHLVQGLQNEGLSILKGLDDSQLCRLVDLLIADKKWVEEHASEAFPFKLRLPTRRCAASNGHTGLSSHFSSQTPSPNVSKPMNQDKRYQSFGPVANNAPNANLDASPPQNLPSDASKSKRSPSREDIMSNCHNLLRDLLKENPYGFNANIFRPAFAQKYGYVLDHQILGYPKLVSLLQTMPGVKIESNYVFPSKKSEDSVWDELGPLSGNGVGRDGSHAYEEPLLSDDDPSESENDNPKCSGLEERRGASDGPSSLLQVLDSWHAGREGRVAQQARPVGGGLTEGSKGNNGKNPPLDSKGCELGEAPVLLFGFG